jgi:stringent starvation protein A
MGTVTNKRSVMTLYSDPRCPYSHRVRMVIAEKGIAVDIIDVDPAQPDGDVMDLNPYGTLPILVDRDLTLYESRIIMEYLDERFPHPPLLPVDPVARASARLFLYRVDRDWFSLVEQIASGGKGAAKARKDLRDSLTVTSPVFSAKPFFMSEDLTLVDCAIAPLLWRLPVLGVELPPQARPVKEYAVRLFSRHAFQDSISELEREMRE